MLQKTELQQFQDHLLYECKNRQNIRDILLFVTKDQPCSI